MKIVHICAGWESWNGAANIARMIMGEQQREGHEVTSHTWASIPELRAADEVWIHCAWKPCLWWAALWGRKIHWMPEASYDPVRRAYHGWKKTLVGPIERLCLLHAKALVATCEAEKKWIQAYLGRRCPPVEVTDIKRFFDLNHGNHGTHGNGEPLHLLYLGRRHPLKGVQYLEEAVRSLEFRVQSSEVKAEPDNSQLETRNLELKIISSAFGEEKEKVWDWCDVLVLPTLSENFGLVVAEALERGKCVITTDGAPAWGGDCKCKIENEKCKIDGGEIWAGYGGRLIYIKGYRDGTDDKRIMLLKQAIEAEAKQ